MELLIQPEDVVMDAGANLQRARPSWFFSETNMDITWRRANTAARTWVSVSRRGRIGGRTASAKWASMRASKRSALANWPVDLAKSRTCRGLTTATSNAAADSAAPRGVSNPLVDPISLQLAAGFAVGRPNLGPLLRCTELARVSQCSRRAGDLIQFRFAAGAVAGGDGDVLGTGTREASDHK